MRAAGTGSAANRWRRSCGPSTDAGRRRPSPPTSWRISMSTTSHGCRASCTTATSRGAASRPSARSRNAPPRRATPSPCEFWNVRPKNSSWQRVRSQPGWRCAETRSAFTLLAVCSRWCPGSLSNSNGGSWRSRRGRRSSRSIKNRPSARSGWPSPKPVAAPAYRNTKTETDVRIRVFASAEALARTLALDVVRRLAEKPDAVLGLPTGLTPIPLYRELVRLHHAGKADFSRAATFNLDEFLGLAPDDPRSYRAFMQRHLFDHINISPRRIQFLDGTVGNVSRECQRYERAVERAGGIDLQILGLGLNGHIGFNEPARAL